MNLGFDHPRAAIRDRPASRPSRHGGCDHADLAGDRAAGDRGQQAPVRLGAQREHAGHSPVDAVSRRRGDCPYYVGAKADLENYYLTNLIGNPLDTTVMLANLMFSGRLDELPDLKIVLAHGGGFIPYQIGRLVHGHSVRSEANGISKSSPKDLLKRIYFDSLVFEPQALRYLIDLVGADHVCIGTDAPFDMADDNPKATIDAVPGITSLERQCVCCGTALKLLCEG